MMPSFINHLLVFLLQALADPLPHPRPRPQEGRILDLPLASVYFSQCASLFILKEVSV